MADVFVRDSFTAKRARKACLSCRTRKIRCNVEQQGPPCSNCLTDGIQGCRTVQSLRGKNTRTSSERPAKRAATKCRSTQATDHPEESETSPLGRTQVSPMHTVGWLEDTEDLSELRNTVPSIRDQSPQHSPPRLDARFLHQELSYVDLVSRVSVHSLLDAAPTPPRSLITQSPASHTCLRSASLNTNKELPDFICPLPPTLSRIDLDYLYLKGALELPSGGFLKALLNAFVQFVYPYAPVIDLSTIIRVLEGDSGCIGILLFQSIVFAAVAYVDIKDIQSAGFTSRRACRKVFYERARLLYDNDVEVDKLATVQAVLLLSYWADAPGDNRGCWYWMGIAMTLAEILGLHRKAEYKVDSPISRLRKRVWWACYLRDRMLGIAIGRPLRIRDVDMDTPALTLKDFEIVDFSQVFEGIAETSRETQVALAERCINEVELCRIGTKVLELHFSMLPGDGRSVTTSQEDNGATSAMIFLKDDVSSEQLVQQYDQQLQAWYKHLPLACVYRAPGRELSHPPCLLVGAASLNVTFWSIVSALHRPQLRHRNPGVSIKRVGKAAIEISQINRELHQSQLDRYLPASAGISHQHTPFIVHAKWLTSRKARRDVTEILDSLFYCIKVLETAREIFPGGDTGLGFMLCIARRSQLTLLFDQDSKLWGIGYQGMHYSPGSQQLSLNSRHFVACSLPGPSDTGQSQSPFDNAMFADNILEPVTAARSRDCIDLDLPLFDQMESVDWSSLADFMPMSNLEDERSLGFSTNLDDYIHDVETVG